MRLNQRGKSLRLKDDFGDDRGDNDGDVIAVFYRIKCVLKRNEKSRGSGTKT